MNTRQEVKRWLWRYRHYKRMTSQIQVDIEELRMTMDGLKAQRLTGMPGAHGTRSYRIDETLDRIAEKEKQVCDDLNAMLDARQEIELAINSVPDDDQKEVLYYRYIIGLEWKDISPVIHYEWTWMHELHRRALDKVAEYLNCEHKRTFDYGITYPGE